MTAPPRRCVGLLAVTLVAWSCRAPVTGGSMPSAGLSSDAVTMRLPTRYLADRFVVTPVTIDGDTLELYTDTGGGANMLWESTVRRLRLATEQLIQGSDTTTLVRLPRLSSAATIPLPQPGPPFGERFFVPAPRNEAFTRDGFLGRTWFADRVWIFDYPAQSLLLLTHAPPSATAAHRVPLGFQTDSAGRRTTHFPRIRVAIDGDSLDLLFDTGATISLTDSALARLADGGPVERGGSFIAQNVFERWRSRHPDWLVIERADRTLDMPIIRVPEIAVAGYVVGPVWFAMRPDRNFHQFMSQWMDRKVEGAIGGSALRYFRVTVDYPNAVALFERP